MAMIPALSSSSCIPGAKGCSNRYIGIEDISRGVQLYIQVQIGRGISV